MIQQSIRRIDIKLYTRTRQVAIIKIQISGCWRALSYFQESSKKIPESKHPAFSRNMSKLLRSNSKEVLTQLGKKLI